MNIEQALIIAHELKTEFKIGNWSHFIGETSFDEATDIEIAEIVLNTMNAVEQKMHPTAFGVLPFVVIFSFIQLDIFVACLLFSGG